MIKKIKQAFFAFSSAALALPAIAVAQYNTSNIGGVQGVPKDANANAIIVKIINWLLGILAGLAVLMIVVAGIMYITSQGDEGRVDSAKKWLTYAIVGLVVALLGYVIVAAVGNALGAG
jgi:glucose uptake protein GlcU